MIIFVYRGRKSENDSTKKYPETSLKSRKKKFYSKNKENYDSQKRKLLGELPVFDNFYPYCRVALAIRGFGHSRISKP